MPSVVPIIQAVGNSTRRIFDLLKYGLDPSGVTLPTEYEHLRPELTRIADRVLSASQIQYQLDWNSETYYDLARTQDGSNQTREKDLRDQFCPLDDGDTLEDPCVALDTKGSIEAMYLPDAINPQRLADICRLMENVGPCLERNGPIASNPDSPDGWRRNSVFFRKECEIFSPGLFTASPGWQMRGHEVKKKPIVPSKDLATLGREPSKTQALLQSWIIAMTESALILSAVLAVAHPEQFELNLRCLEELCKLEGLADVAVQWGFAFNVVSVISNRATPEHRDTGSGGLGMLDLLLTMGGGPRTALELPGLGMRFKYDSGTIVLFSGHVHLHTVSPSQEERVCIACYSRKAVYHKFGLDLPGRAIIYDLLSDDFAYL